VRTTHRVLLAATILCVLPLVASVRAASLSVAPTRVELGPGIASATVTLQNEAETPVTVQVQTFAWLRSAAADDLAPTRDVLAVPPVFSLAAKGKQIIRVALRGAPSAKPEERAYRLLITEVPEGGGIGLGVRFALRLSLPIFVTPAGARALPAWAVRLRAGAPELELTNRGTAHIQVRRIVLRAPAAAEPVQVLAAHAYVLPGQTHHWPLARHTHAHPRLHLQADTDLGPLEAELVLPPG
jgi:fimbrial chaperone protein